MPTERKRGRAVRREQAGDPTEERSRSTDLLNITPGTRERILAAATALFGRSGYMCTSIREIIEAAGVTRPMLYYYFRNKNGLYLETIKSCERRVERLLEEIARVDVGPKEKIEQFCLGLWLLMQRHRPLFGLIREGEFGPVSEASVTGAAPVRRRIAAFLHGLVEEGQRTGTFRVQQPEAAVTLLMGVICSAEPCDVTPAERPRRVRIFEWSLKLAFDGISSTGESPPEDG